MKKLNKAEINELEDGEYYLTYWNMYRDYYINKIVGNMSICINDKDEECWHPKYVRSQHIEGMYRLTEEELLEHVILELI